MPWKGCVMKDITEISLCGVDPYDKNRWLEIVRASRLLPSIEADSLSDLYKMMTAV